MPSSIPCPKKGAEQSAVSTLHPVARIFLILTFRPVPHALDATLLGSSKYHARMALDRPRTPHLRPELSKWVRSHYESDIGDVVHRHLSIGNPTFFSVPRRQSWIFPTGPLFVLPDPGSRF